MSQTTTEPTAENPPATVPETKPATPAIVVAPAQAPATPPASTQVDVSKYETQIAELQRERDADRAQLHTIRVENEVARSLADPKLKIKDSNIVTALINPAALKFEEKDGKTELTGLDAEIARVRAAYPTLFGALGKADGASGANAQPPSESDGNAFFRDIFGD